MGHELHITRAANWHTIAPDQEISARGWLEYVERDPELRLAG